MTEDMKERKILQLDKDVHKPFWGVIICIPRAAIRRAQSLLGMPEVEATWFVARRYTDVELPEDMAGMPDDLYVSRNLDFASQMMCLSITSTTERKGMFALSPGCEYPRKLVR